MATFKWPDPAGLGYPTGMKRTSRLKNRTRPRWGRLGGLKRSRARADSLTAEERG
jgi:hypothetical protein